MKIALLTGDDGATEAVEFYVPCRDGAREFALLPAVRRSNATPSIEDIAGPQARARLGAQNSTMVFSHGDLSLLDVIVRAAIAGKARVLFADLPRVQNGTIKAASVRTRLGKRWNQTTESLFRWDSGDSGEVWTSAAPEDVMLKRRGTPRIVDAVLRATLARSHAGATEIVVGAYEGAVAAELLRCLLSEEDRPHVTLRLVLPMDPAAGSRTIAKRRKSLASIRYVLARSNEKLSRARLTVAVEVHEVPPIHHGVAVDDHGFIGEIEIQPDDERGGISKTCRGLDTAYEVVRGNRLGQFLREVDLMGRTGRSLGSTADDLDRLLRGLRDVEATLG
ncbi:MAG: hypothetical protein RIT81_18000 [Deltaproteobacteria bacterium]